MNTDAAEIPIVILFKLLSDNPSLFLVFVTMLFLVFLTIISFLVYLSKSIKTIKFSKNTGIEISKSTKLSALTISDVELILSNFVPLFLKDTIRSISEIDKQVYRHRFNYNNKVESVINTMLKNMKAQYTNGFSNLLAVKFKDVDVVPENSKEFLVIKEILNRILTSNRRYIRELIVKNHIDRIAENDGEIYDISHDLQCSNIQIITEYPLSEKIKLSHNELAEVIKCNFSYDKNIIESGIRRILSYRKNFDKNTLKCSEKLDKVIEEQIKGLTIYILETINMHINAKQ